MLRNKFTILLTVAVLFGIAVGLQFINGDSKNKHDTIAVMPEDVALVIETDNIAAILDNFNTKNQFKLEFSDIYEWQDLFEQSEFIDSVIKSNSEFREIVEDNKLVISARVGVGNKLEFMYCLPLNDSNDEDVLLRTIASFQRDNESIAQQIYEGNTLYNYYESNSSYRIFSYSIIDGLFIISREKSLVEETIRNLKNPKTIVKNKGFVNISETAGNNADMNIYINYFYFPNAFKSILSKKRNSFYDFFRKFADWTELDLRYKNNSIFMSGFTNVDNSAKQYLKILNKQSSLPNDFLEALPGNTAAFIAFNISNPILWKKNYDNFLQETGEYAKFIDNLDSIGERTTKDIRNIFYSSIEGAVCVAYLNKNIAANEEEVIAIMELNDEERFVALIQEIHKNGKPIANTEISGNKVFNISEAKLFKYLFGNAFAEVKSNFYMIHQNRLIVAKSIDALKFYLRKMNTSVKLVKDKNFIEFAKSLSSESNIYAYMNFEASKSFFLNYLNNRNKRIYKKNADKFNKIYALAIQYGVSKHGIFTNICANFNKNTQKKSKNAWEVKLDTSFSMKPVIVKNHNTGNNEVLIQDNADKLILISTKGKILWKKQLDGKILGSINQVDRYKNKKIQYLFNTHNKLYLVDRNGKDVEGFPVVLPAPASNACAVFDYDNNLKYRILIAFSDKNTRMYDIEGKKVDGWNCKATEGIVSMPAQHFINAGKDYIIFADFNNTYIVNRKGEQRIIPKAKFQKNRYSTFFFEKGNGANNSRFIIDGQGAYLYFIFLDGSVKKMNLGNFSDKYRFKYIDIDGTGKQQVIVADKTKLYVFNRDKSLRFELEFKGNIGNSLNTYKFGTTQYIGVAPMGENKIYLINHKGKIVKGFPMTGKGAFSIGKLDKKDENKRLNVITGSIDNYLFNYMMPNNITTLR